MKNRAYYKLAAFFAAGLITIIVIRGGADDAIIAGAFALIAAAIAALSGVPA